MNLLSVSDVVINYIYSPAVRERFGDVDMVIACGDLPYYYMEYIVTALNRPLFYVLGNHENKVELRENEPHSYPWGCTNLHRKVINHEGLLMAGIEGSLRYNNGPCQYTQGEMWEQVFKMVPTLLLNRFRYGRYLDIFISHAPPWQLHDMDDLPHQGIKAFRWLLKTFKPAIHLHGHIHVYRPDTITETWFEQTRVINTYGFRRMTLPPLPGRDAKKT